MITDISASIVRGRNFILTYNGRQVPGLSVPHTTVVVGRCASCMHESLCGNFAVSPLAEVLKGACTSQGTRIRWRPRG